MSQPVKLAGSLPAGEPNGLGAHTAEYVDHPEDLRVIIAIVDVKKLETSIDTGEITPTLRIRRIESIPADDLRAAKSLFRRAHEDRTGRVKLPLEVEDEISAAFENGA